MSEYILTDKMRAWASANGYSACIEAQAEYFNDYIANRTKKYKDLDAAFRNCVRSDWGRIRWQTQKSQKDGIKPVPRGLEARPGESMDEYLARLRHAQQNT